MRTKGSIAETNVRALVEAAASERVSGTLTLRQNGSSPTTLYFLFGRLFHATGETSSGDDAVVAVLGWAEGEYDFDGWARLPADETVHASIAELIERVAPAPQAAAQPPAPPHIPRPAPRVRPTPAGWRRLFEQRPGPEPGREPLPLPAGDTVYQALKVSFVDFPRLIATLEREGHTGYVRLVTDHASGLIYLRDGAVLECVFDAGDDAGQHLGQDALARFNQAIGRGEGVLDVVQLAPELVEGLAELTTGQPVATGLYAAWVDVPALLRFLEERRHSGTVAVRAATGTGVIIFRDGRTAGAYMTRSREVSEDAGAVLALCRDPAAAIEVRARPVRRHQPLDVPQVVAAPAPEPAPPEAPAEPAPVPRVRVLAPRVPWQSRLRYPLIAAWLLLVAVAVPFAAQESEHLTGGGFDAPGSGSAVVSAAIRQDFAGLTESPLALVLVPGGDAGPGDTLAALQDAERRIEGVEGAAVDPSRLAEAEDLARREPSSTVVLMLDSRLSDQQSIDSATELRKRLGIGDETAGTLAGGRVRVHVVGQGAIWSAFESRSTKDSGLAEARGFPVVAVILFVVFGALSAMLLPLGLGAASVIIASAAVFALSLVTDVSVFASGITSMIGIGVAVDYSLFVLVRYREAIAEGASPDEAIATALATSGRAVVFSGLTVVASLATLFRLPNSGMRSLALGAIVVVAVSVLAAVSLLPALLRVIGPRWLRPGRLRRTLGRLVRRRPADSFWARWAGLVMRRPAIAVIASSLVLLVLAVPALKLEMRNDAAAQLPPGSEAIQARQAAAGAVGAGALGPVYVLLRYSSGLASSPANQAAADAVAAAVRDEPQVRTVAPAVTADDERSSVIPAVLFVDPESSAARREVERLRDRLPGVAGTAAAVSVGGVTANLMDFDQLISASFPSIVGLILALAFVVLFFLLRSVVLPLKAICMNLLAVAAAYGTLVAVFQWGWLGFLGLPRASAVDTVTPTLVLAVAFGLSMDYEVFLLSRIRERYEATGDTARAVAEALATSAAPISSAALIMVAVFLAFVSAGMPTIQRIGFAMAVVIALDATLVRLVLVPAAMRLLGRWNWWLPGPLARRFDAVPQGVTA